MANLVRVRVVWTGGPVVGGGVSTFYFDEAHTGFVADLAAFFTGVRDRVPLGVTWTIPAAGDLVDVATGQITGSWTDAAAGPVTSTGAVAHAAGVGARAQWRTSGLRNGRRVVGSTFLCPLTSGVYESDGTLGSAFLASLLAAAQGLVADSGTNMRVYSRPDGAQEGQENTVTAALLPDKVSWLRSRRT